ncbi:FAD-dependent monooxygenase [uncultured Arthrobacter sp.]|uniref:FAD-dependent monooxygenase n=1 Tax=uncultured Arthrobacter sp. TaxID=114050 RepID=UPI002635C997|nr:FAD-dependent monooxygenase [uncultured Arthrobacter sp.]
MDVLVVGAGPTGLMLANWLVRLGVRLVLIDGKDGPTIESRALGVQSRSMEIYDQLGVIDRVLDEAVRAESMRQGFGRRAFAPVPLTALGRGITPYPGLYVLEQSANERILADHLRSLGGTVRWRHRLVRLETSDGVTARIEGPEGQATVHARFVVGCDGASSTVRTLRGIAFEGTTSRQTFYLVDAVGVDGLAPASVNIRQGVAEFLLAFPMRPDAAGRAGQRLIGLASGDDGSAVTAEHARERLRDTFGVTYADQRWFSTYRVHHRIAGHFRDGPVLLAGDAAHVHSPVGAQGMNTGLQDAHNLAFALDRYEAERRPVALRLLATTDRLFRGITSGSAPALLVRRYVPRVVLPLAVAILPRIPLGRRLAGYLGRIRIRYPMEAAGAPTRGSRRPAGGRRRPRRRDPVLGRRLPWTGGNFEVLRSAAWQVHLYAADEATGRRAAAGARELGLPLHAFGSPGSTRLRPGTAYLVRPDGFVAAIAPPDAMVGPFRTALTTTRGPGTLSTSAG